MASQPPQRRCSHPETGTSTRIFQVPFSLSFPGHPPALRAAPELWGADMGCSGRCSGDPQAARDGITWTCSKPRCRAAGAAGPARHAARSAEPRRPPATHLRKSAIPARSKLPGMLKQQPQRFAFSVAFDTSELTPRDLLSPAAIKDV